MRGRGAGRHGKRLRTQMPRQEALRRRTQMPEQEVQDHFSKFGRVLTVKFLPQRGDAKAAFVDFDLVDDARDAHRESNMLGGNKLRTDYNKRAAFPSPAACVSRTP